ncbi:acetate--CoA ligase [Euzebya tangerina]|uniref:acetate--CoA ligase n=1 Tax=Euzebya tangerina TaxID=591198 RepID=UPI000E312401|nr:acetate--CoA ligase [Euzebya tangerina]
MSHEAAIENLSREERTFPPTEAFAAQANLSDPAVYEEADADFEGWWAGHAEKLRWMKPWDTVLEWEAPHAKWFVGGTLNISDNCLDRHIESGAGDKVAYHWEGEPVGETRTITYSQLKDEVCQFANALKAHGVGKGDRVAIYLPMIPELPVAMLACARIGAIHSVVFAGFSSQSLADRIDDADAKMVITSDGANRRGKQIPLKSAVDEAIEKASGDSVETVVVVDRTGLAISMQDGRDVWYHEAIAGQSTECAAEEMDAEDVLYILYTSGTTGKPKGIVHTTGGYLTQTTATQRLTFDLKPDTDVYWCAADIGWVTGHSYIVYAPLANQTTSVMYEGTPDFPDKDRFWDIVERYGVTILYTAPTAIRAFMKWGAEYPESKDLSSLRVLGTVGEPINPEAWMWYREHIGPEDAPIVDTWWQTETGGHMITPLPGITASKPGSAMRAFPGIKAVVVDDLGDPVEPGQGGYLTIQRPWPSMLRTIWGDDQRFKDTYWARFGGDTYFAGDGAKLDEDGAIWVLGRVDDVMNVSGHRMSTTEIESALVDHESVAESAVVGRADDLTGQAISAFVTLVGGYEASDELEAELKVHVGEQIGKIARPAEVYFTPDLPKTRSGKIMRRLLKQIAEGTELGDATTLANPDIVTALQEAAAKRS